MANSTRTETIAWPTNAQLERRIVGTDGATPVTGFDWADVPLGNAVQDSETGFWNYKLSFTLDTQQAGYLEIREKVVTTRFQWVPLNSVAASAASGGNTIVVGGGFVSKVSNEPVTSTLLNPICLKVGQWEGPTHPIIIEDGDGNQLDLNGLTLRFIVFDKYGNVKFSAETGSGITISVSAESGIIENQANIDVEGADTGAHPGDWQFTLRDIVGPTEAPMLAFGPYRILRIPMAAA